MPTRSRYRGRLKIPENNYITRSYEMMKNNEKTLEEINSKLGGILLLLTKLIGEEKWEN
jgi:hypothetical protein